MQKGKKTIGCRVAAFLLIMVLGICSIPADVQAATKNGWSGDYYYVDGKKQTSKWIQDGNDRYYVGKSGKKLKGWHKVGNSYYFFNQKGNNYKKGKKIGVQITKLSNQVTAMGIDVSKWQGNIDWDKVKDAGIRFAIIRIGYGKGRYGSKSCTLDDHFKEYVEGATKAGIPIGIYFYSYAKTHKEALKEAEFTIEKLDGVPVSLPVAYDIEDDYIIKHTTKASRTAIAKTYMDTIAAAGYTPMFYCNQNWYNNYLDADKLSDYDFWYARYTYQEPDISVYPYTIWQATSTQSISGITENTVDIDFMYKDYLSNAKTIKDAMKYGWHKEGGKWRYYYQGKKKSSGWFTIGGNKYYFKNSAASTGWKTISGKKYYFNSKGEMQTGITKVGIKYYMLDDEGVLQTNTSEPGVQVDSKGVCKIKKGWYKDSKGKYFYRYSSGKLAKNKWITTKGKKYYVGSNKRRTIGFKTINGKRYYFDKKGVMKKGWLTYKGHKYYFKKNGQMVKGKTIKIKGKKYTFKSNGQLKK